MITNGIQMYADDMQCKVLLTGEESGVLYTKTLSEAKPNLMTEQSFGANYGGANHYLYGYSAELRYPEQSTAYSRHGPASWLFHGSDTSDNYMTVSNAGHNDWKFSGKDFTIDFNLLFDKVLLDGDNLCLLCCANDVNNYWGLFLERSAVDSITRLRFVMTPYHTFAWQLEYNFTIIPMSWKHIALVMCDGILSMYEDGQRKAYSPTPVNMENISRPIEIGYFSKVTGQRKDDFRMYIDEFRLSKGIARWLTNFVEPRTRY